MPGPPHFADPIDAAVASLPELEESEIDELLRERVESLRSRLAELDRFERGAPAPEIVERRRALLEAELSWTGTMLERRGAETSASDRSAGSRPRHFRERCTGAGSATSRPVYSSGEPSSAGRGSA